MRTHKTVSGKGITYNEEYTLTLLPLRHISFYNQTKKGLLHEGQTKTPLEIDVHRRTRRPRTNKLVVLAQTTLTLPFYNYQALNSQARFSSV